MPAEFRLAGSVMQVVKDGIDVGVDQDRTVVYGWSAKLVSNYPAAFALPDGDDIVYITTRKITLLADGQITEDGVNPGVSLTAGSNVLFGDTPLQWTITPGWVTLADGRRFRPGSWTFNAASAGVTLSLGDATPVAAQTMTSAARGPRGYGITGTFLGRKANQAAMLALSGAAGDWVARTDIGTLWVVTAEPTSVLGNWLELEYPSIDSPTSIGRALITAADAAAARSTLGIDLTDLDEIEWFTNFAAFPGTGVSDLAYGARDTGNLYRWNGASYDWVSNKVLSTGITDSGTAGRAVVQSETQVAARTALGATTVGSNVFTAADAAAARTAIGATTAGDITAAVNALIAGAPGALDTLNELAAALGNDANFAATVATALSNKQPLDGDLTAIAALTSAANKIAYATGAGVWALADFSAAGRALVDDADAAAQRTTLGATTVGSNVFTATSAAVARLALGPQVFDARDYGVIADGSPHNNVANLLDCFAQAYAAGSREVLLPAGVIDTSDAVIGTVTATSGNVYTNNGGVPLPTGGQAITVTGHGKGATTIRLSPGFTRLFDFWLVAFEQVYKGITLRDFTVDRNHMLGVDVAAPAAVSGGVTLTPSTWVTLPGISATTFRNAQYVFFPTSNAGTAKTVMMPARVNGSTFQVYNTGSSLAMSSGDQVQGSLQSHTICGTWSGMFLTGANMYIDDVLVENVDAINIAESTSTFPAPPANHSAGITVSVYNNSSVSTPHVVNFRARNVRIYGGSQGICVYGENEGTFVDEVWYEDCFHDTMIDPITNWHSSNFIIGVYAWTNRCGIIRCHGRRSGDVACEVDQPWEAHLEDNTWEEAYNGNYTSSFVPPARTAAGPPTTTLNNGSTLSSGATSVVITALPASVDRSGIARIGTELVWYVANAAGTTLTLTRGLNGSSAASHVDGSTVTFVEIFKTRVHDTRTTVRNKDVLALASNSGRAFQSFTNNNLPLPPLTIREPTIDFTGGKLGVGRAIYWDGWRPDFDMEGLRLTWNSLSHTSGGGSGSLMEWLWTAGSALSSIRGHQPLIRGRNNQMRVHGKTIAATSLQGFRPGPGFARLDFDLAFESILAGADYAAVTACVLTPTSGTFVAAAGSRVGIKMSTPPGDSDIASAGLVVGSTSVLTIAAMLDVDIDLYDVLTFDTGDGTNSNYRAWTVDSSQVGKVRFGKIVHSRDATVKHPTVKKVAVSVSANYTVRGDDEIVLVNTSGGAVTITLPNTAAGSSSAGEPMSRGRELKIIDAGFSAATNNITITPFVTDKIDNGTAGASVTIVTNGGSKELAPYASMPGWVSSGGGKVTTSANQVYGTDGSGAATSYPLSSSALASSVARRDANANIYADAFVPSSASTATAAGTTTLTVDSAEVQVFTGSTTQTVTLPTTSIVAGQRYTIINNSTGAVTVNASGGAGVAGGVGFSAVFTALQAAPTLPAHWSATFGVSNGASTAAAASTIPLRDGQANLLADAFIPGLASTATAATTTTLTVDSTQTQVFTGSTTQIVTLPTTSIVAGQHYTFINTSSGAVTINSSGANLVKTLVAGASTVVTALVATPTTAAHWFATA